MAENLVKECERRFEVGDDIAEAAKALGMSRTTLERRLLLAGYKIGKKYFLEPVIQAGELQKVG